MHKLTGQPEEVEEIVDGEVREVAAVDKPATGLEWRFFKAISPTLAPGANYMSCLATGRQPTPTLCEAGGEPDTLGDISSAIEADLAGHDAKITSAKAALAYVDAAIARGELGQEGSMKRQAKCPTGTAREDEMKEMEPEAAEAPPVPEDLEDAEAAQDQGTIEIPATPTPMKLGDCINQAQEMGLDETLAASACGMIRSEFGDPGDEENILIPDGIEVGGLINLAAISMGKRLQDAPAPPKGFKFSGRSRWMSKFKAFLGLKPRPAGAKLVEYLRGVERRLEETMSEQVKSRAQLDRLLEQQGILVRSLAAAVGAELPDVSAVQAPAAAAPVAASTPANPVMAEGKSADQVKDGAAVAAPVVPQAPDRIALLEQQLAEMRALMESQFGGGLYGQDEDDLEPVAAGVPVAAAPKRVSVPGAHRLTMVKSVGGQAEQKRSSITGMPITDGERHSARQSGGIPRVALR